MSYEIQHYVNLSHIIDVNDRKIDDLQSIYGHQIIATFRGTQAKEHAEMFQALLEKRVKL